ncbi:MAG: hypothetical protein IT304_09535 [Dehalococcoidia bacterium]|nr:hypothetical protein [Dehalococcoidia bacterium]
MNPFALRPRAAGAVVAVVLLILLPASPARADGGEAGLVVDDGGVVETFCVPFDGDGITGEELLRRANVALTQFAGAVCALGSRDGCFAPKSYSDCFCQCPGGASCTYWAFFTKPYGREWSLSQIGFQQVVAHDGDLQGWRWGKGSFTAAPPPPPLTFEQVCGHPPSARASTSPPPPTATVVPPTAALTSPPSAAVTTGPGEAPASSTATSVATTGPASATADDSVTRLPASGETTAPSVTIISHGTDTAGSSLSRSHETGEGGGVGAVAAFAAVAAGLLLAIGGALLLRRRRATRR